MYFLKRILSVVSLILFGITGLALATTEYTPLISSDMFDGVRTDVNTAAAGIITILIIVVGLGLLVKVFR
nr:hypothetical protein [uncultured Desulfobacter sp.]